MPKEKLRIDPEFKALLEPLSDHEYALLKENILAHPKRPRIIYVWQGRNIVVDGHHTLKVCREEALSYKIFPLYFSDRQQVRDWIVDNQAGRRNLSDAAKAKLREERIKRVAELRAEGMSTTAIASEVGVGQTQVRRDLAQAQVSPPAKVTGVDGKKYHQNGLIPEVAALSLSPKLKPHIEALPVGKQKDFVPLFHKHGANKAYRMVMNQREPGEEEEPKPSANGKPLVDWKGFVERFGRLQRWIDDTANTMGIKNLPMVRDLQHLLDQTWEMAKRCFQPEAVLARDDE